MIVPVPAAVTGSIALMAKDKLGGSLTIHKSGGLCGMAINDCDGDTAGFLLNRDDRAGLIAALIELQEDEGLE